MCGDCRALNEPRQQQDERYRQDYYSSSMEGIPAAAIPKPGLVRPLWVHSGDPVIYWYECSYREEDGNAPKNCRYRDKEAQAGCRRPVLKGGADCERECQRVPEWHELAQRGG